MTSQVMAPDFVPQTTCWVCGGRELDKVCRERIDLARWREEFMRAYDGRQFWLCRCRSCGFMQPEGLPVEDDFFEKLYGYDRGAGWMEEEFAHPYKDFIFTIVLDELGRRLPTDRRRLLDVGTHVGKLPSLAKARGWAAEGIELNPNTAAFAASRSGCEVHRMAAEQLATTGRLYDAITIIDVLEHIPKPAPILAALRQLIAPGGWIAVKVPNGQSQLRKEQFKTMMRIAPAVDIAKNMVHVNHFSPRSLRIALEVSGFTNVAMTTGAPELPLVGRSPAKAASWLTRQAVYAAARIIPGAIHTPLSLNLQAYAQVPSNLATAQ